MSGILRRQQQEIDSFWHWFQNHIDTIMRLYARESQKELFQLLSPRIKQFDDGLVWELGPGAKKAYEFTISPNRSATLLRTSEAIVARSPTLDEWEFYSAKPKKEWDFRIELANQKGQTVGFDASNWKYYLTGYEGQSFFDIVLVAHNLPRLDQMASQQAASLVLEGALGERKMIEKIGDIKIVTHIDPDTEERLSLIHFLDQHLDSLAGEQRKEDIAN